MPRFNLVKIETGERFKIDKNFGLNNIRVELSFSGEDLDVQAWLLNQDGLIVNDEAFVFYNSENRNDVFDKVKYGNKRNYFQSTRPMSADGAVLGSKDELEGGIETVNIDLSKVAKDVQEIVISATVYEEGKTFGDVADAKITVIDEDSSEKLCYYELSQNYSNENACVICRFVINDEGDWEVVADGKAYDGGLNTLVEIFTEE